MRDVPLKSPAQQCPGVCVPPAHTLVSSFTLGQTLQPQVLQLQLTAVAAVTATRHTIAAVGVLFSWLHPDQVPPRAQVKDPVELPMASNAMREVTNDSDRPLDWDGT
jgi:hypothetical protein